MMYRDFYGLKRAPLQITPAQTFFFVSASHKAALGAMTSGIDTRQGLVAITRVPGVGKTTLVRAYLAGVAPPQLTTFVLWQARVSLLEILTIMTRRFDAPVTTDEPEAVWTQMQQRLRQECCQGRNVALIIDEAQHRVFPINMTARSQTRSIFRESGQQVWGALQSSFVVSDGGFEIIDGIH
jgi:type II secretory pathway predicted ATPase ExeA